MRTISFLILAILLSCSTNADVVRVAVASNFRNPMIDIARQFESNGEHTLVVSYGASGKLFAQIINGAPFDVFLSADQEKPQRLIDRRLAIADTRMTYAYGQLILWSAQSSEQSLRDFLVTSEGRIAMANPRLAPYGQAALETLRTLSLIEQTQDRWVMGENIAQTFHFVHSGNATAGFIERERERERVHKRVHETSSNIPLSHYIPNEWEQS
ncbi:MAG: molybdate ABC transporter substrate-binding protein [Pseudomonadota bacterium]